MTAAGTPLERAVTLYRSGDLAGCLGVARSLVEMLRTAEEPSAALAKVREVMAQQVDDPVTLVDIADLQVAAGRLDDALVTYRRLGDVEGEGHRIFAWHGMIGVEIRRE